MTHREWVNNPNFDEENFAPMKNPDPTWLVMMNVGPAPESLRSLAVAKDGTIFVCAVSLADTDEWRRLLRVLWNGNVPHFQSEGHLYVPTSWVIRDCPELNDICSRIEHAVRHYQLTKAKREENYVHGKL
jgi:hypothetical protein